ncbi:anaerobic ribonucleoside-triphosphate reductase activating protein [Eggerthella sp. YY7918]|uniref:anaerobic ribonucleoside-triphosphate reductase activating protein n=1 Tax=Eggerthella sp. (strain YY7918) TaxID=502558 RepID=UPI0002170EF2|nr:anaerobic ribonucleoside-triphosphate reductase activating protein [Eggerthella sp. YY7918]BAK43668.1 pyruvate-formate lyase-activating enzyme [Eggerthella sp. YY7918]
MRIAGLQKLTLLDFPGHTAATVFTPGCNFRCPFCHNADLVVPSEGVRPGEIEADEVFAFLEKRHGLLDGVCITGGEPLLQPGLADFCARVRERGFAVKLDTNGSFPDHLHALMDKGLVDYVAMDVKNAPSRYAETVGVANFDLAPVRESIELLLEGTVPFEFRTTVVQEFHAADDLEELARWITSKPAWFLQSYLDAENVLAGPEHLHAWNPEELRALLPTLRALVPHTHLRGIDE